MQSRHHRRRATVDPSTEDTAETGLTGGQVADDNQTRHTGQSPRTETHRKLGESHPISRQSDSDPGAERSFRLRGRAERAIAAVVAVLAAGGCWPAYHLGLAEGGIPEAGMVPLLIFAMAAVQATCLAVRPPYDLPGEPPPDSQPDDDSPASEHTRASRVDQAPTHNNDTGWRRPLFASAAVTGYLLFLPSVGYLIATAVFCGTLLLLAGFPRRWIVPAALLLAVTCYLLFQVTLQVPFPAPLGV